MSQLQGIRLLPIRFLFVAITPAIVALTLYRFSHYFYIKRLRFLAWLLWLFNQFLTGVDITPGTEIGESCYIGHPVGTIISGKLGKNVTMFGGPCIGGGRGRGDVGAGEGLPVIGNNVVIGIRAMIFGPIRIGNNVTIGAGALMIKDVKDDVCVVCRQDIIVKSPSIDYEEIAGIDRKERLSVVRKEAEF
jgi:serine O-acetyltransferase